MLNLMPKQKGKIQRTKKSNSFIVSEVVLYDPVGRGAHAHPAPLFLSRQHDGKRRVYGRKD